MLEALQSRLKVLEDEILRVAKLAAHQPDEILQDNYWRMAHDLQREARQLRSGIRKEFAKISETQDVASAASHQSTR